MLDVFLDCSLTKDLFFRLGLFTGEYVLFLSVIQCVLSFRRDGACRQPYPSEKYINLAKLIVCFGLAKHFAVKIVVLYISTTIKVRFLLPFEIVKCRFVVLKMLP